MSISEAVVDGHNSEPHHSSFGSKLNWLRAGVLGANDGIVSTACILLGVIAAGSETSAIMLAGVAAAVAGAVSMALGEYVSVSAQRDTERYYIDLEKRELKEMPEEEHKEMVDILRGYGITDATADKAVSEMEQNDPLKAHLQLELGIDDEELTNPWVAAGASAFAFTVGALLPILSVLAAPKSAQAIVVTVVTLLTLTLTGFISAKLSGTKVSRSVLRLLIGGALGLVITYFAGALFGSAGV